MADEKSRAHNGTWSRWLLAVTGICLVVFLVARALGFKTFIGPAFILMLATLRLAWLNETDCRTVAIAVGMQNGGMVVGLAIDVLKSTNAALAPAMFGTWMNVSGSTLASWWRERMLTGTRRKRPKSTSASKRCPLSERSSFDKGIGQRCFHDRRPSVMGPYISGRRAPIRSISHWPGRRTTRFTSAAARSTSP